MLTELHQRNLDAVWQVAAVVTDPIDPTGLVPPPAPNRRPVGPFRNFDADRWHRLDQELVRNTLSQLAAGERLVMVGCEQLAHDSSVDEHLRRFAHQQHLDEARHVDAVTTLCDALSDPYPPAVGLVELAHDLETLPADMAQLAMQGVLEPMTINTLTALIDTVTDPTAATVLRLVRSDESRHVGFGAVHLTAHYRELTSQELFERQQFVIDVIDRLEGRLVSDAMADRIGMSLTEFHRVVVRSPTHRRHRHRHWSTCVRMCRKVGLAAANNGWLEQEFHRRHLVAVTAANRSHRSSQPFGSLPAAAP